MTYAVPTHSKHSKTCLYHIEQEQVDCTCGANDMKRVLICGGREYAGYLRFASAMAKIEAEHGPFEAVIHGALNEQVWV